MARATFGAQAHIGIEATFRNLTGVTETRLGFLADPAGQGTASAIEIKFDPTLITYSELLEMYWRTTEPPLASAKLSERSSSGTSIVYYHDNDQRNEAITTRIRLERGGQLAPGLLTDILPATPWLDVDTLIPPGAAGTGSSSQGQFGDD